MKIIILLILVSISNFLLSQNTTESNKTTSKVEKSIQKVFNTENVVISESIYNDYDKEHGIKKKVFKLNNNNELIGFLVFSKAKGRFDYFEYFVLLDETMKIKYINVYNYISEHGYQICNKRWLSQFYDYTYNSKFNYNKEISAISGATISGNSIVTDVKDVLKLTNELK